MPIVSIKENWYHFWRFSARFDNQTLPWSITALWINLLINQTHCCSFAENKSLLIYQLTVCGAFIVHLNSGYRTSKLHPRCDAMLSHLRSILGAHMAFRQCQVNVGVTWTLIRHFQTAFHYHLYFSSDGQVLCRKSVRKSVCVRPCTGCTSGVGRTGSRWILWDFSVYAEKHRKFYLWFNLRDL